MAYSTPEKIRMAVVPTSDGQLPTTPTHTAADLSDDQLLDAIAEADAMIDSMIGRFYATPAVSITDPATGELTVPHPLDYWSRNIAAFNATLSKKSTQDLSDRDPVVLRYNATMDALRAVNAGSASLSLPRNEGDSRAAGADPAFNPYVGDLWTPEDFSIHPRGDGWSAPTPYWDGR